MTKLTKKPKAFVIIDGSNTYFAQKKIGQWLDWVKTKRFLEKGYQITEIYYYVGVRRDDQKMLDFLKKLNLIGFVIREKPVKLIINETGDKVEKANFDVEITGDALEKSKEFDILILFSGDSDFAYLVELLHRKGKEVYVFSSRKTLSWELKLKTDRYFLIEKIRGLTKTRRFVRIKTSFRNRSSQGERFFVGNKND